MTPHLLVDKIKVATEAGLQAGVGGRVPDARLDSNGDCSPTPFGRRKSRLTARGDLVRRPRAPDKHAVVMSRATIGILVYVASVTNQELNSSDVKEASLRGDKYSRMKKTRWLSGFAAIRENRLGRVLCGPNLKDEHENIAKLDPAKLESLPDDTFSDASEVHKLHYPDSVGNADLSDKTSAGTEPICRDTSLMDLTCRIPSLQKCLEELACKMTSRFPMFLKAPFGWVDDNRKTCFLICSSLYGLTEAPLGHQRAYFRSAGTCMKQSRFDRALWYQHSDPPRPSLKNLEVTNGMVVDDGLGFGPRRKETMGETERQGWAFGSTESGKFRYNGVETTQNLDPESGRAETIISQKEHIKHSENLKPLTQTEKTAPDAATLVRGRVGGLLWCGANTSPGVCYGASRGASMSAIKDKDAKDEAMKELSKTLKSLANPPNGTMSFVAFQSAKHCACLLYPDSSFAISARAHQGFASFLIPVPLSD